MNQRDIEQQLQRNFIAQNTLVTYLGKGGVVSAILRSVSYVLDIFQYLYDTLRRSRFLATATGDDLDALGEEVGVARQGANASGVVLTFTGTSGTVIPSGTVAQSASGVQFVTTSALTLGALNPSYSDVDVRYAMKDKVFARANVDGLSGNVPAKSITQIQPPIDGVRVTNHFPAQNGKDKENDTHYRARIALETSRLDRCTIDFYRIKSLYCDTEIGGVPVGAKILRVLPVRVGIRKILLWVVTKDGAGLSASEKAALKAYIERYNPVLSEIIVENVVFTPLSMSVKVEVESGYTALGVWPTVAGKLAEYINWSIWRWGENVDDAELVSIVKNCEGIANVVIEEFYTHYVGGSAMPGDVFVPSNSLPRLTELSVIPSSGVPSGTVTIGTSYDYEGVETLDGDDRITYSR